MRFGTWDHDVTRVPDVEVSQTTPAPQVGWIIRDAYGVSHKIVKICADYISGELIAYME